jgi:TrmH family RNA methyltransferase
MTERRFEQQLERKKAREITSTANPLLKIFRHALTEGTTREGWLAVEGPRSLVEALSAGEALGTSKNVGRAFSARGSLGPRVTVQSVLVAESATEKFRDLLGRLPAETEVVAVADHLFERVAATPSPQGIAALVELKSRDLGDVLRQPNVLMLVAGGLQDPGNLGTIMRSGQALGANGLITLKETVSPFNAKAARSSAGAIFHLPIFPGLDAAEFFPRLRAAGVRMVAADRESPNPLDEADLRGPHAFLIGRESSGLPKEIATQADLRLSIPIRAGMDSINAATAAGIFLYEAARQRKFEELSH